MDQPIDTGDDPAWIYQEDFRRPRFVGDPLHHREIISQLREILVLARGHRQKRWGFAIVRTSYGPGSDEQMQCALALIRRTAQVFTDTEAISVKHILEEHKSSQPFELADLSLEFDTRPNQEILSRFENDVLEDAALEDASVATVREYFADWIATKDGPSNTGDIRFISCVILDAETLAQLATVPGDFPETGTTGFRSPYWVKVVEVKPQPEEAFRVYLFGEFGLAQYWFDRNHNRRSAIELTHNKDPKCPGIRYFGYLPTNVGYLPSDAGLLPYTQLPESVEILQ
ncbi:hypothetical protein BKA56DRAFT_615853 [Ilyonectria sp. MPI-CAGE-AT-0026]|nr:hypothetical protein BKA56DRAFT_615853 [Ilyonectria sp. MPI-CAGE-AT-0026]